MLDPLAHGEAVIHGRKRVLNESSYVRSQQAEAIARKCIFHQNPAEQSSKGATGQR